MGLLLDVTEAKDSLFVDPVNLTDDCDAAVPGLVGGFILNGACGLSGGGRIGAGFFGEFVEGTSVEAVVGLDDAVFPAGGGGKGLFGGSVVGDPGPDGMLVGDSSSSFAGGDGGIVNLQPFPFWFLLVIPSNPISFSNPKSFSIVRSSPGWESQRSQLFWDMPSLV